MTYIILLICFAIGVPIVFSLGLSCVLAILTDPSMSMIWITQKMFAGVNSFPYLALPFFILAGNIMAKGGISRRLVKFCSTLVGRFQGGPGHCGGAGLPVFRRHFRLGHRLLLPPWAPF